MDEELVLHSPVGTGMVSYKWTPSGKSDKFICSTELVKTIRWVSREFRALKDPIKNWLLRNTDVSSFEGLKELCERFNNLVSRVVVTRGEDKPSRGLVKHILQQTYNESVEDPEKLNQYEPFSPEVYGETSFDLISQIIDRIEMTESDIFMDLGSGVGQVVLQIAALTPCRLSVGIEKADIPSEYAERMRVNFGKWARWFGVRCGEYTLLRGDFLDEDFLPLLTSSTVVFVNNFAFGPELDHLLKERFAESRDGTRIVSSKAFVPLNFRTNERNLSDIGTIMHIREMSGLRGSVSWTSKPVTYYLHIVDRGKLERFFEKRKWKREKTNKGGVEAGEKKKAIFEHPGLEALLATYRDQFRSTLALMRDGTYRRWAKGEIRREERRKTKLIQAKTRIEKEISALEKNIKSLKGCHSIQ